MHAESIWGIYKVFTIIGKLTEHLIQVLPSVLLLLNHMMYTICDRICKKVLFTHKIDFGMS